MILRASPIRQLVKVWGIVALLVILVHLVGNAIGLDIGAALAIDFALVVLGIFASLIYWFIYTHHYLKLEDKEVIYYSGVINLKSIRVPYSKIDNVRTERSLLSRLLGLVDIYIDTPGEQGVEIVAKEMPFTEFQIFYVELRKKMEENKGEGYP